MDPRGAAALSDDPAGALLALAARSPDGLPHLLAARERTRGALAALATGLGTAARDEDASVVLFGSYGRAEVTRGSDDDWVVLVDGPARAHVRPVLGELGPGRRGPAAFGDAVFADDLVAHIGLARDDNRNLTRRMLLVLESVAVVGEDAYRRAWRRVLDGYLVDVDAFRPPRFFLNDLIRYWRTICVDFEGKARRDDAHEVPSPKYAMRLAKLRTSRKVLFAGGLLPALLCHLHPDDAIPGFLAAQLATPPTDRLASAFLRFGAADAGLRALGAYDRWLALLDDPEARAALERTGREDAGRSEVFHEARRLGDELQGGLLALLFDTPLVGLVREYGLF